MQKSVIRENIAQLYESKRSLIAFNIQNLYHLSALRDLTEKYKVPVIAQVSAKYVSHFEKTIGLKGLVDRYQHNGLYFHLDHCTDEAVINFCVDAGFSSVMFDGSSFSIEENISRTNQHFEYASRRNCLLEAELGAITGVEDGVGSELGSFYSESELLMFHKKARYDMLALAIGNAHGVYASLEGIDIHKLERARELVGNTFFVLHGGTGMPKEMIERAIAAGVIKINVSTALKMEYLKMVRDYATGVDSFDEIKYFNSVNERLISFFGDFVLNYTLQK